MNSLGQIYDGTFSFLPPWSAPFCLMPDPEILVRHALKDYIVITDEKHLPLAVNLFTGEAFNVEPYAWSTMGVVVKLDRSSKRDE